MSIENIGKKIIGQNKERKRQQKKSKKKINKGGKVFKKMQKKCLS